MTAAQASAAFAAHATGFPATHVNVIVPPAPGIIHLPGTAAALGITAPIAAAGLLLPQLLHLLLLPILHHIKRLVKIIRY